MPELILTLIACCAAHSHNLLPPTSSLLLLGPVKHLAALFIISTFHHSHCTPIALVFLASGLILVLLNSPRTSPMCFLRWTMLNHSVSLSYNIRVVEIVDFRNSASLRNVVANIAFIPVLMASVSFSVLFFHRLNALFGCVEGIDQLFVDNLCLFSCFALSFKLLIKTFTVFLELINLLTQVFYTLF